MGIGDTYKCILTGQAVNSSESDGEGSRRGGYLESPSAAADRGELLVFDFCS